MNTREKYLAGEVSHEEYYRIIAKEAGISFPVDHELVHRALKSTDKENLNDIPLHEWDGYASGARSAIDKAMRKHGDWYSMAGGVCVMKNAVKKTIEDMQEPDECDNCGSADVWRNSSGELQCDNCGESETE